MPCKISIIQINGSSSVKVKSKNSYLQGFVHIE